MYLCSSSSDEGLDQDDYQLYDDCNLKGGKKFKKEDDYDIEEIKEAE